MSVGNQHAYQAEAKGQRREGQCALCGLGPANIVHFTAEVAHQTADLRVIDRVVMEVAELPDRTSPDDWPEAMLVTAAELRSILQSALKEVVSAQPHEQLRNIWRHLTVYTTEAQRDAWGISADRRMDMNVLRALDELLTAGSPVVAPKPETHGRLA